MKNYRKLILGVLYLGCVTYIAHDSLRGNHPIDAGFGAFAAGLASGVCALVWGYNKEHEATAKAVSQ